MPFTCASAAVNDHIVHSEFLLALARVALEIELQYFAVHEHMYLVFLIADIAGDFRMSLTHKWFPMLRDHMFGMDKTMHHKKVIPVAVSRGVQSELCICFHRCTFQMQVVHNLHYRSLVSNNGIGTQYDGVTLFHDNLPVSSEPYARKAGILFTLAPGSDNEYLLIRKLAHAGTHFTDESAWGLEVSQILSELNVGQHAPARDEHFPVEVFCMVDDLLGTVEQRTKCGDDHTPLSVTDQIINRVGNLAFAQARAGFCRIC